MLLLIWLFYKCSLYITLEVKWLHTSVSTYEVDGDESLTIWLDEYHYNGNRKSKVETIQFQLILDTVEHLPEINALEPFEMLGTVQQDSFPVDASLKTYDQYFPK